jgi:hypothetical protein
MVGPEVVDAVAASFEATDGSGWPLAERMILALEAGQAKGGDRRWGSLQSAAIKVADPNTPGRGGDNIAIAIEVGENPEPVAEMKRIYYTTQRRLGYRSFSRVEGTDVVELKRMLQLRWAIGGRRLAGGIPRRRRSTKEIRPVRRGSDRGPSYTVPWREEPELPGQSSRARRRRA